MNINIEMVRNTVKSKWIKYLVIVIIIIIIITIIVAPFNKVGMRERGVVYNNLTGKINKEYLKSGLYFIMPFFQKIVIYPLKDRTYTNAISRTDKAWLQGSIWIPTTDNHAVNIDLYCTYRLLEDKLGYIYERFNGMTINEIESEYLDIIFRYALHSIITQNSTIDVYTKKRLLIQEKIQKLLNEKLNTMGIEIEMVYLKEVRLTPAISAIFDAETRSRAMTIEAQGRSEANHLISKSLDENLIRSQAIEKLSSEIKLVIVPANTSGKIDYDKIINQVIGK